MDSAECRTFLSRELNNIKRNLNLIEVTLKWSIPEKNTHMISKYLIYMSRNSSPNNANSSPIGCVDAMELPMACTLSNLSKGSYKFYIRAKDNSGRVGPSSNIEMANISQPLSVIETMETID